MNIGVYFKDPNEMGAPFTKESYFRSYQELAAEVAALGDHFFVVRGEKNYLGNGVFSTGWELVAGKLEPRDNIACDLIYNKDSFPFENAVRVFNAREVDSFCTNKWLMYQKLTKWCPQTLYVTNQAELEQALANITTDKVVVKPVDGAEGREVHIGPKAELVGLMPTFPVLVQAFLDSSGGIPGIVEGTHDFRIAVFDGEILYSYYRTPPAGSLLANVSLGGRFEMIEPSRIPRQFREAVTEIDQHFASYPHRFYGVDFALTQDGPKIIEMNAKLGLLPNSDHPIFAELKKKLAQAFHDLALTPLFPE
jgi:glutathione synthase/RimK-type ligase-like ATP-grasp enzyme